MSDVEPGRQGESDPGPVRVIIVDDDPRVRRAVRDALQDAGIIVIAEAGNGEDAVALSAHYSPDVVLMDIVMPGMDGITATRRLLERAPSVKVLVLSAAEDDDLGMLCLRSGAAGFLSKSAGVSSLPRALTATRDGEVVISQRLTAKLVDRLRRLPADGAGMRPVRSPLTAREWEVLDLLCQQSSTEQIAADLVLSPETVRSHVKNILRKLEVGSRKQAVDVARRLRSEIVVDDLEAA